MSDAKPLQYEVEIIGHAPPFQWKVFKRGGSLSTRCHVTYGKADSFEEAREDAETAARKAEFDRVHQKNKETVKLFQVNERTDEDVPFDPLDLENWPVIEEPEKPEFSVHPYDPPAMESMGG